MADEISKEELKKEIEKILKDADLAKTSVKKVIQKLEKNLGVELADKKKMIDQMVMDYVNSKESDGEEDEEEEEEEEEYKPKERAAAKGRGRKKKSEDEYEDSEDEEDEKPAKKKAKKEKAPKKKGGGRGKGGGYTRAYKLSPELAALMGKAEMPRHEVVKRVWALVKERQLYDPNNKQFAICDDALYKVFGTKRFRIFGMMKYLKNHFLDD